MTEWRAMLIGIGACAALFSIAANAHADPGASGLTVWLSPGIYSRHFDRGKGLREDNVGPGVEVALEREHVLMAGYFANSNDRRSRYAGYQWRALQWQPAGLQLSLGIAAGVFDGYPNYRGGGWFVAALPVVAVEGRRFGVNVFAVPTIANRLEGAIAVQLKLKAW